MASTKNKGGVGEMHNNSGGIPVRRQTSRFQKKRA